MRCAWLVVLCACGRLDFTARPDAASEPAIDAAVRCDWNDGVTFGPVTRHATLDSGAYEFDPILVRGDPLTIYLGADTPGDIYTATRPDLSSPFGPRTPVTELNTAVTETGLSVDTTGAGYMVRQTTTTNILEVRRDNGTFTVVRELLELDGGFNEYDPWVSADGLELWFTVDTGGDSNIFSATRATTSDTWSNIQPFVHNTPTVEASATLTVDRLVVAWTKVEGSEVHLRYATRPTIAEPWSAPQTFPFAATYETEPALRDDGCELFFCIAAGMGQQWDTASVQISTPN